MTNIVVALITSCIPAIVTIITSNKNNKEVKTHAHKQSILQLILEDKVRSFDNIMPENYQEILHEYDLYIRNGGNSYVKNKVEDYIRWYEKIRKIKKGGK